MTDPSTTPEAEANPEQMGHNAHIQIAFDNDVIRAIVKILKSEIADKARAGTPGYAIAKQGDQPEVLKQAISG